MKRTYAGESEPPGFDDIGQLGRDGVIGSLILLVYLFVPMVVTGVLVAVTGGIGAVSGNEDIAALSVLASVFVAVVVGGLLALVFSYAGIAALANFAYRDSPGAAFAFGDLTDVLTDGDFFRAWLVGVGVALLGTAVATAINLALGFFLGLLSIIPILGILIALVGTVVQWVIAAAVGFYVAVGAYRAYALGFADAVRKPSA